MPPLSPCPHSQRFLSFSLDTLSTPLPVHAVREQFCEDRMKRAHSAEWEDEGLTIKETMVSSFTDDPEALEVIETFHPLMQENRTIWENNKKLSPNEQLPEKIVELSYLFNRQ